MRCYLIIGNGVAGTTAAEAIRKTDPEGRITVVSDEPHPFYQRTRLNSLISGEQTEEELLAKPLSWYQENRVELLTSTRAVSGDAAKHTITLADATVLPYDRLLLACGSHAFIPPIQGADLHGVFSLRTLEDARRIREAARRATKAVLVGGGLLGIETGHALARLGLQVTVVEFFPRLLPRQLDGQGAERLAALLTERGLSFRLGAVTKEFTGADRLEQVILESGEALSTDLVIVSAGVRPNLELARAMGIRCDKGVLVDHRFKTSAPDIFAAGDVAEVEGKLYGIWPAAFQQGRIAGLNMAGDDISYRGTLPATRLKVAGVSLASAGEIDAEERFPSVRRATETVYKKVVLRDRRVIGFILLGDVAEFNVLSRLMAEGAEVKDPETLLAP